MIYPFYEDKSSNISLFNEDCFKFIENYRGEKFDLILTDPPYGITACSWDTMPNLEKLWDGLKSISKKDCTYAFTASQPFTSILIMSNMKLFKYEWIWMKQQGTNPMLAHKRPLKIHENIVIFSQGNPKYNPQMEAGKPYSGYSSDVSTTGEIMGKTKSVHRENSEGTRFPVTVIKVNTERKKGGHPTQKPLSLMEYLVKTYTDIGDFVFDPFSGSGTTLVACRNLERKCIGVEVKKEYCEMCVKRLNDSFL